jgi:hypothetical protein
MFTYLKLAHHPVSLFPFFFFSIFIPGQPCSIKSKWRFHAKALYCVFCMVFTVISAILSFQQYMGPCSWLQYKYSNIKNTITDHNALNLLWLVTHYIVYLWSKNECVSSYLTLCLSLSSMPLS